ELSSTYDNAIAQSIADALRARDYGLILCVSDEDPEIDLSYLKMLQEKRVDGIIYIHPLPGNNSPFVRNLVQQGLPIIEMHRQCEEGLLDAILADNVQGAYQITKYLLDLGHCRIGLVLGETELTTGENRLLGYRRALDDAGIPFETELVRIGSFSRDHGEIGTHELLQLARPPTAILAGSSRILMGILTVLGQLKLSIPNDISVAAFNDAEWMSIWKPAITVVDMAIDEMAQLAVDLLLRRITSPERRNKPTTYLLRTFLIERDSCRSLSSSH
ncbi:MAG TPA: substrate-binding domain-containing protein, partial [Anaerolineae bacterium]